MSTYIDYNYILTLLTIQKDLYRIGGPILISIGMISNILSLLVFFRKNLRKNPCAIYFMAFNIANILYILSSLVSPVLYIGYNTTHTAYNIHLCRLQIYLAFVLNCLCPLYLLLASIDRILITSHDVNIRRRSTRRLAWITIVGSAIFWMVFLIFMITAATIIGSEIEGYTCLILPGTYTVVLVYASVTKEILTPTLMILCGLWSIKNIRRMRHVAPVRSSLHTDQRQTTTTTRVHSIHGKDRQLILMLFIDISIYVIFSSFLAIVLVYNYLTEYLATNPEMIVFRTFIQTTAIFSSHIPFCITSYAHLTVSKTFRNELKNVFLCR